MVTIKMPVGDAEYLYNLLRNTPGGHGHITDQVRDAITADRLARRNEAVSNWPTDWS